MMAPLTFLPMDNLRASPDGRLHEARGVEDLYERLSALDFIDRSALWQGSPGPAGP